MTYGLSTDRGLGAWRVGWSYGPLASAVYDLDKPIGRSFGDLEYYERSLAGLSGRILEPAVGTGRVLIPLLESGHDVEGFDVSADMLEVCRRRCRERGLDPPLRQADMTTFVEPGAFAAVILPAGSIALLDGRDATVQALRRFRECLQPSGTLLVDVPPGRLLTETEPMRHWRRDDFVWTLQTQHVEHDPVSNGTTRWLRYEKWHDGALVATELQLFRLQHWSVAEFEFLLVEAGFTDVSATADYRESTLPGVASDVWTFHASTP